MDALDDETKDSILREIGALFPNVSDLSFFRQVFDNENWDLEKSIQTIKSLLEDVDDRVTRNASSINNNFETGTSSQPTPLNKSVQNAAPKPQSQLASLRNYSTAMKNNTGKTGAIPKSSNASKDNKKVTPTSKAGRKEKLSKLYNDVLKQRNPIHRITSFSLEGIKVMIIMRGCPGSGKTFLVNNLATNLSIELSKSLKSAQPWPVDHHIFSADDFWVNPRTGKYIFNSEYIEYAHLWNQKLVRQAASEGRSPLFIDNTHTRMWEMKAYATLAVEFGYVIEIVESPNKWAFNENELVRRNIHGVHRDAIRRMLDRYEYHIKPAKLLVECRLTYPQNVLPPQRTLVSFNTPPSKNQQKIFNSSFYCVSLDSILSLKSGVDNLTDSQVQFTKPPNFNPTNNSPPNNIPVKLVKEEVPNPFRYMYDHEIWLANSGNTPLEENTYFVGDPNLYSSSRPPTNVQGSQELIPPQTPSKQISPVQPHQAPPQDVNIHSKNYFWEKPAQPSKPKIDLTNQMQNSSIDLLLSLDENTLKALLDKVIATPQPPMVASTSNEIENQVSSFFQSKPSSREGNVDHPGNLNSNPSDSSVDLLSFEDIEVPSLSSDSFVQVESIPPKAIDELVQPVKSTPSTVANYCTSPSSCDEVFSDESDDTNSGRSSCEVISLSTPSDVCDEFGFEVTQEYVLVQPNGSVVYQISHEGYPTTLKEFVATSELSSPKKKSKRLSILNNGDRNGTQRSSDGKLLSKVNKFVNSSFLKTKGSGSYIDDMSASAPVSNDSVQSLNTKQNHELLSKSSVGGNVPLPTFDYDNLPPDLPSGCTSHSSVLSSTFNSNLFSQAIAETKAGAMASEKFEPGLANPAETWKEEPVKESTPAPFVRSDSPKGQRSVDERSLTAPVRFVRSNSSKGQRSIGGPSLTKTSYDFWCNTNYVDFDTLSKVNNGTYTGTDVTLVGTSDAFQSSPSPQKFDSIKAVATHDKSSMTSSKLPTIGKDSGIEILTKMFPEASAEGLAELFEKCRKDLDWTVNLMIDSGSQVSEHFVADEVAHQSSGCDPSEPENDEANFEELATHSSLRKNKKSKHKLTKEYSDLVKEFEANFVLNEGCYSERLKKVRETKFGKPLGNVPLEEDPATRDSSPSNDHESSTSDSWEEDEGDMGLVMTNSFIAQLQSKFGPVPNMFGDDLVVKLPVSLARQIYSYALDSICQNMEEQQNVIDMLVKEDEEFARELQGQSSDQNGDVSFQEIMDYEIALRTQQGQSGMSNEPTFASTLSHQLLTERFPGIDPTMLKTVLDDTNRSLHQATNLLAAAGHVPVDPAVLGAQSDPQDIQSEQHNLFQEDLHDYRMSREESITQANAYHEVALKLNDLRKHYFLKAQESYNSGNHAVAAFYRDLVNWYTTQIKESNSKAAKTMLYGNESATTLDLHFLGVSDAVHVLDLFLDEGIRGLSTRKREIFIITGRGLHSADGKSKIKPAIKQRLKQRGLKFSEINPGMIKTAITKSSTVSYKMDRVGFFVPTNNNAIYELKNQRNSGGRLYLFPKGRSNLSGINHPGSIYLHSSMAASALARKSKPDSRGLGFPSPEY